MLLPQWPYPSDQGAKLRNAGVAHTLAQEHELHALCFGQGRPREPFRAAHFVLPPNRRPFDRVVGVLRSPLPDLALRLWSSAFRDRLTALLASQHFDVVHVSNLEMAVYFRYVPRGLMRVFDDHNAEYVLQQRAYEIASNGRANPSALYSLVQWRRLSQFEAETCRSADLVLAVSAQDAERLAALDSAIQPVVVPNALDPSSYPLQPPAQEPRPFLLFSGKLDYRPNADAMRWFLEDILPLVWRARPEVRLLVVGQSPPPWLVERGKRDKRIVVTGPVADDRLYLRRSAAYVLPMRWGGGVRFKALVALASGRPLVSTTLGAEGLGCTSGRDAIIADDAGGFARAVLEVLERPDLAASLATAGRALLQDHFSWASVAPTLLGAYSRRNVPVEQQSWSTA